MMCPATKDNYNVNAVTNDGARISTSNNYNKAHDPTRRQARLTSQKKSGAVRGINCKGATACYLLSGLPNALSNCANRSREIFGF